VRKDSKSVIAEAALRTYIRNILTEAPYTSSPVTQLGGVRAPGLSIKTLLQGLGITVLMGTYGWLKDLGCAEKKEGFPLLTTTGLPNIIKDKTWSEAEREYNTRLNESLPSTIISGEKSDFVRAVNLYQRASESAAAWPAGSAQRGVLDQTTKDKITEALSKTIALYSNCQEGVINGTLKNTWPTELNNRDEYIRFLKDVTRDTHETFARGLGGQKEELKVKFPGDSTAIDQYFANKITRETTPYNKYTSRIK
jgi:hypothetical protein